MLFSLVFFGLCGCSNYTKKLYYDMISKFPSEFTYVRFENGKEVEKLLLKNGDKLFDELNHWVLSNNDLWKISINTYAPQQYFSSEKVSINVIDEAVIINFNRNKNNWVQIIRNK